MNPKKRLDASVERRKVARSLSGGHCGFDQSRSTENLQRCRCAICVAQRSDKFERQKPGPKPGEEKGQKVNGVR